MQNSFNEALNLIINHVNCRNLKTIGVAVSGGSDSTALTLLADYWTKKNNVNLIAFTVDHKLRPESSNEAKKVHDIIFSSGINHEILKWHHGDIPISKIQLYAREARYWLLENACIENNVQMLLTGHTFEDQIETYYMRLQKNSGEFGLSGMSAVRSLSEKILLARPLLKVHKEDLRKFLKNSGINHWVEDPSNSSKNFLRSRIRELLTSHDIEEYNKKVISFGRKRQQLEQNMNDFINKNVSLNHFGYAEISKEPLEKLPHEISNLVLKRIAKILGGKKYFPRKIDFSNKTKTVCGSVIKYYSNAIKIYREIRNLPEVFSFTKRTLWDRRYILNALNQYIAPIGLKNAVKIKHEVPVVVFATLPCIKDGQKIVSIPHLEYGYVENRFFINDVFLSLYT